MVKQSLVRSIGFVALALQAWSLSAALSSSSYVQEGLVAQFDGVENVTRGVVHDASATQWNDLVSGGTTYFTLSEGASFAGGNGFSVVQTWRGKANSNSAIYKAAMSTNFTFEVAYDQTSATEYEWTKGLSKRPKGTMLQFFHSYYWMGCDFNNNNGQMDCYVGFNPQGRQRGPGLNLLDYSGATGYSRGKHTLSCSQDAYDTFTNTACNISFDGVVKRTYTVDATVSANASRDNGGTWLNGNSSYENSGVNGIYHDYVSVNGGNEEYFIFLIG